MGYILGGWGVDGALFSVGGVRWGCIGHYFGWVVVSGALFWVGGGGWENILGGWVGMSGVGCTV